MTNAMRIDKIMFTPSEKGHRADLTMYYRECHEPSEMTRTIEDIENGHTTFFLATGEENFDIVNNVTIIYLSAENLRRANEWFSTNSASGLPLPTQKV